MESSSFCVSVLYPNCAQSRSVENEMPTAYCVKCKTSIEIKDPQNVTLKNGKPAVKGVCPNCGTSVFRIGKAYAARAATPPIHSLVFLENSTFAEPFNS